MVVPNAPTHWSQGAFDSPRLAAELCVKEWNTRTLAPELSQSEFNKLGLQYARANLDEVTKNTLFHFHGFNNENKFPNPFGNEMTIPRKLQEANAFAKAVSVASTGVQVTTQMYLLFLKTCYEEKPCSESLQVSTSSHVHDGESSSDGEMVD